MEISLFGGGCTDYFSLETHNADIGESALPACIIIFLSWRSAAGQDNREEKALSRTFIKLEHSLVLSPFGWFERTPQLFAMSQIKLGN